LLFVLLTATPPISPVFPYTTLFRSEIERIAGGFDLSLAEIESVSTEDAEAVYGLAYLRGGCRVLIDAPGQNATEVVALGAEAGRSEEHTSELQSRVDLVCRLLLEKK